MSSLRPSLRLFAAPVLPRVPPGAIIWIFVGIVAAMLAVSLYTVEMLAAGRTFIAAEGRWAKAERDAALHLARYLQTGASEDYLAYQAAIGVIEGSRAAREELGRPEPDMGAVRAQLRGTGVTDADVDDIVFVAGQLAGFEPSIYLVNLWRQADVLTDEIRLLALSARNDAAPADAPERLQRLQQAVVALEEEFARTLTDIQRTTQWIVTYVILIFTCLLLIAGISTSRRFLAQHERLRRTLSENESQLRHVVETAPLPLLIVRASDQRILYANGRALEQFAFDLDAALGYSLSEFHVDADSRTALAEALSRRGRVRDTEVRMRDAQGRAMWLLLSAEATRYGGEVCLLVALADIDERKRLQDDMRRKAMHDPLTGLPNRAMFMEALDRAVHKARRRGSRFSVVFIDLDHFKEINDSMGHHAGDVVLKTVSERLSGAVRAADLVGRLAGDEFVVLIEEHGGPEEVMIVAQKVLSSLQAPITIDWRELAISGSVGVASYPEDGADVATLVRNADTAMYQAKELGRNNFQFYSEEKNELSRRRLEREKRIRGAIERSEFFLEYQPEHDAAGGRVVAVEALLRWRDPVEGVLAPPAFMPHAEEAGAALDVGLWVLDRALADLRSWHALGLEVTLAVNFSARQLQQPELPEAAATLFEKHAVRPASVRIEVQEPTLLQDSDAIPRAILAFRAMGCEIAIDNFGTGYSSLGLVRGIPVQVVKIDKSLVSHCPNRRECAAIVQACLAISRNLGIRVVAEGIENEEQLATMRQLGCDSLQGYFVSPPVDAAAIAATMRAAAEQTLLA
jgi:diguanylate cyclase (GGDEF)-like protein/PAS domain S-box-containing protein